MISDAMCMSQHTARTQFTTPDPTRELQGLIIGLLVKVFNPLRSYEAENFQVGARGAQLNGILQGADASRELHLKRLEVQVGSAKFFIFQKNQPPQSN